MLEAKKKSPSQPEKGLNSNRGHRHLVSRVGARQGLEKTELTG